MVRHPVLRVLSGSASDFALHSRLVALQKREIVTDDQKFRDFQFALRRPLQGLRGLCEPVEEKIVDGKTRIREWDVRIEPDGLLGGLNSPFILAGTECDPTRDNAAGVSIARIRLCPRFESLQLLLQVPGYLAVVEHEDVAPLPIADAIPKPVGYADFLGSQIGLAHVPRHKPEIGMRHRELRIDGDGLLEMRDRGRSTMRVHGDLRRTVRFQSFQRRRGCLLQRCRVLLDAWPATRPAAS